MDRLNVRQLLQEVWEQLSPEPPSLTLWVPVRVVRRRPLVDGLSEMTFAREVYLDFEAPGAGKRRRA